MNKNLIYWILVFDDTVRDFIDKNNDMFNDSVVFSLVQTGNNVTSLRPLLQKLELGEGFTKSKINALRYQHKIMPKHLYDKKLVYQCVSSSGAVIYTEDIVEKEESGKLIYVIPSFGIDVSLLEGILTWNRLLTGDCNVNLYWGNPDEDEAVLSSGKFHDKHATDMDALRLKYHDYLCSLEEMRP